MTEQDQVDALFAPAAAEEAAPQQPEVPAEQPQTEPAQEPAPQQEEPARADPAPETKQEHTVPLAKFLDQRDELKELRRYKEEQERTRAQAQPQKAPDPVDDPEGYTGYLSQQLENRILAERMENSKMFADREHGSEKVEAALNWAVEQAGANPAFAATYMRERDPIGWIVRQHQREAMLTDIGDNLDDWFAREALKRGYQPASAAPAAQPQAEAATQQPATRPAAPPKSIAGDSSAPAQTVDPVADFNAIFAKR